MKLVGLSSRLSDMKSHKMLVVAVGLGVALVGLVGVKIHAAEHLTPSRILKHLGSQGRDAGTAREVAGYHRHFDVSDGDKDGKLSREEFVDKGLYLNPRARAGIFRASDTNKDGFVSRDEYVVNRRITDEAKAIMGRMDADRDGRVTHKEFMSNSGIADRFVAASIFELLDADRDGSTVTPEYLRVWGAWARAVPVSSKKPEGLSPP
jgi:Ca2+-binding EF-hand superfamily protein